MLPVGHIAGTAAAVIGAVVMASGALLGRIVDSQVTDSVTPFMVGFAIFSAIGWVAALDARRHRPVNASPDHDPSTANPPGLNHRPEAVG